MNCTPGPWTMVHKTVIEHPTRISQHFAIRPQDGPTIAFLPEGRKDMQEANARLMAAAPDLLAICQAIEMAGDGRAQIAPDLRRALVAALVKAQGGNQLRAQNARPCFRCGALAGQCSCVEDDNKPGIVEQMTNSGEIGTGPYFKGAR